MQLDLQGNRGSPELPDPTITNSDESSPKHYAPSAVRGADIHGCHEIAAGDSGASQKSYYGNLSGLLG